MLTLQFDGHIEKEDLKIQIKCFKSQKYDFKVTNKDAINVSKEIVDKIINK